LGWWSCVTLIYILFQGFIPKNDFGNIDLYVPSMLPEGAVHIPCMIIIISESHNLMCMLTCIDKGAAKVARQLGFDYAEAVVSEYAVLDDPQFIFSDQTSFEFKKQRAFPVITGIVAAAEHEDTIVEVSNLPNSSGAVR